MVGRSRCMWLMVTACVAASSAYAAGVKPRDELKAAMRQARDGDLQADWNKMMDARERFIALTSDEELSALAHYYVGYTNWRLSSLAFVAIGPGGQGPLLEQAVAALESALQKRPQFADAQALLATCLASWAFANPSRRDELIARVYTTWKGLPADEGNPRVMLLRAMSRTFAPPPYGDREKGLALWREAIAKFPSDHPEPTMPDWGDVEAVAWLGGFHLFANEPQEAVVLLERAVKMRPDFWWAGKAALPVARRPIGR